MGNKMKLYYSKGACSLGIRIILHELGIATDFESVDLKTKITEKGENFLTINPKGAVPVLVLDNKLILTENTAIEQYLADSHPSSLLPPLSDFKRYQVLEWLSFISTDLHKGCGPLFNPTISQQLKDEIFKPILENKFILVDLYLKGKKYLMNEVFTLPDAYLFVVLRWQKYLGIDIKKWSELSRYFSEMKQRPSVAKALAEERLG